jgi:hypothetical protein
MLEVITQGQVVLRVAQVAVAMEVQTAAPMVERVALI